jgi:hypothetical protein
MERCEIAALKRGDLPPLTKEIRTAAGSRLLK